MPFQHISALMSLFGSIQLAGNTLRAADVGLQVVGNNIANANTPGYARQEVVLEPAPTQRLGNLLLGLGVRVVGIAQKVDENLNERLRNASSDAASSETQKNTYEQLEGLVAELGENDLSTSLNNFFASVSDVLNQPESVSVRNLAMLKGKALAGDINRLAARVRQIRSDTNARVVDAATNINRLLNNIRDLNIKVAEAEGGVSKSDAASLRDQRNNDLAELAKLIDIKVHEQPSGGVAVFTPDGDYLVFEGNLRNVRTQNRSEDGQTTTEIRLVETDALVSITSGQTGGLIRARDEILGGFLDTLDTFAQTLAFEFNKLYASGQGLNGYSTVSSEFPISDTSQPLDDAGLPFTPVNGSFDVLVYNKRTKLTQTTKITVDLNGLDSDTSLASLQSQLSSINGISAAVSADGRLTLTSDSADQSIAFANDTSGVLASLGLNTFFSGSSALNLSVNPAVVADPSLFAASKGGVGADTNNAVELVGFLDRTLDSQSGATLNDLYAQLTGDVTQASAVARSVFEGFKVFEDSLNGQAQAVTGVNLDEEAIKMLGFQRVYQASAKFISTVNDLLGVLIDL